MAVLSGFPQVAPFPTSEFKTTSEYRGANVGQLFSDQSGNIYVLVDCQESFLAGEVVVINENFQASQATDTSRGAIGVMQSAPTASDTYAWAQIYGRATGVFCASGVTSVGQLILAATSDFGSFSEATSTGAANVVEGALARSACDSTVTMTAASTAVGTATVQLMYPYVRGAGAVIATAS